MAKQNNQQRSNPRWTHIILSIVGALLFYVALYVVSKWFPIMTGHTMQSDWAVILVASVPLVIAIAYMIMDIFPRISAEVGGVKVSLDKAMDYARAETVRFDYRLENSFVEKGSLENLNKHIEELRNSAKPPSILLVPLRGGMHITFPALKQYVHGLSQVSSMRFIVFVDMDQHYLGFMHIDKFISKYPRTSLEIILDDMISDEESAKYWSRTFQLNSRVNGTQLKRDLRYLLDKQWRGEGTDRLRRNEIVDRYIDTESDVVRLGCINARIAKDTKPIAAYNLMRDNGVNGIPVVDALGVFTGMVMKEDLLDQLIEQLLANAEHK